MALEQRDRAALSRLSTAPKICDLPVQTLSVVCGHIDDPYGQPLMRRAHYDHPDNFHINFQLAWGQPASEEAIRFYTAALATRPRNAPTAYYLGGALRRGHKLDEAINAYRKAIDLDPE